ncbi:hypothetical protein JL721_8181 [Aureococcus anophagefferens]|nr:hypothetical protein JL721_8181 [Aureococcus anophagefferens]
MRAFHFQWLSFFVAFVVWFAYAASAAIRWDPRTLPGIWLSNICNVAACVVARFVVGPLGDTYGAVKLWSSEMFATASSARRTPWTGGWGNCGGGFTILMGLLYEALRDGASDEQAWRRAFFAPGAAVLAVAAAMRAAEGTTFAIAHVAPVALGAAPASPARR